MEEAIGATRNASRHPTRRLQRRAASMLYAPLALTVLCPPAGAQDAVPQAKLSSDTVAVAEVFELRVSLRVPEGSAVYFPDTMPSMPELESFSPVELRSRRAGDGGAEITLTYPLIPFASGALVVPGPDVVTVRGGSEAGGERISGGSVVGAWVDVPSATSATITWVRSPDQDLWVEPLFTPDDVLRGLSPRPPSDVLGFGWSLPSIALLLLFSSVVGGAVVTTTRSWLARRSGSGPPPPARPETLEEARLRALAELDRLLASGPHPEERVQELYTASSVIMRRYVERLDPGWGPDLTSTELMDRLATRAGVGGSLMEEMHVAEAVKFGRVRPSAPTSEEHLRTLRDWLSVSLEAAA